MVSIISLGVKEIVQPKLQGGPLLHFTLELGEPFDAPSTCPVQDENTPVRIYQSYSCRQWAWTKYPMLQIGPGVGHRLFPAKVPLHRIAAARPPLPIQPVQISISLTVLLPSQAVLLPILYLYEVPQSHSLARDHSSNFDTGSPNSACSLGDHPIYLTSNVTHHWLIRVLPRGGDRVDFSSWPLWCHVLVFSGSTLRH